MRRIVSNRQWLLLATSAAICVGVLVAIQRLPAVRLASDPEIIALLNERDRLQACNDATRDKLRRQALARAPWTPERLAALQCLLGLEWRWTEPDAGGHTAMTRISLRLRDWPVIIAAVRALEAEAGVFVEGVEITTAGASEDTFSRVIIRLRLTGGA